MNRQIIRRRNARRLWAIPVLTILVCAVAALFTSGITTARAMYDDYIDDLTAMESTLPAFNTLLDTTEYNADYSNSGSDGSISICKLRYLDSVSGNFKTRSVTLTSKTDSSDVRTYFAVGCGFFLEYGIPTSVTVTLSESLKDVYPLLTVHGFYYTDGTFMYSDDTPFLAALIYSYPLSLEDFNGLKRTLDDGNVEIVSPEFDCKSVLTLPEQPTKEGHHFVGWYLDEALTQPYTGQEITEDMTFYAKFEVNTYTVTLDTNGGNHIPALTVEWNTAAQIPEPTRTGYNFLGWFLSNGTEYDGQAVTQDMTLTAKWQIKTYTVTFKVDGEVYKTLEVTHGTTFKQAMSSVKELRYMNLLNAAGEKISKEAQITADTDVPVAEMTEQEKYAEFLSRNMWLVWTLVGLAGAGVFATVIASLVAYKRR